MEIGLDPSNSVIKRLRCIQKYLDNLCCFVKILTDLVRLDKNLTVLPRTIVKGLKYCV